MQKELHLLVCCLMVSCISFSQSPDWKWVRPASVEGNSEGWGTATDGHGNAFLMGYFFGPTISFGADTLVNASQNVQGADGDVFISRYDSAGLPLWAKRAGGTGDDRAFGFAADKYGNSYVTGYFMSDTIFFDSIGFANNGINPAFPNTGRANMFIGAYDSGGNLLWARQAGGPEDDGGTAIAIDADGNVLVAGFFSSDSITFGSTTLYNANTWSSNVFIVKYDRAGNVLFARGTKQTHSYYTRANAVAIDKSNNIYVAGAFDKDSVRFGSVTLSNSDSSWANIFIVKYDSSGQVLWARQAGGAKFDAAYGVTTDLDGNVYLTGGFGSDTIQFGGVTLVNPNPDTALYTGGDGIQDFFLAKYDLSGNVLWAKEAVSDSNSNGFSVGADAYGNIYASGGFNSKNIKFDGRMLQAPPVSSYSDPLFLVKFDSDGKLLCGDALASGGDDKSALSIDDRANVYIAGDYFSIPFVVDSDTLPASLKETAFLAKFICMQGNIEGMETVNINPVIELFPNPATDQLNITTGGFAVEAVHIYNAVGRLVMETKQTQNSDPINISTLASGIYIAEVKMKEGTGRKVWVKM